MARSPFIDSSIRRFANLSVPGDAAALKQADDRAAVLGLPGLRRVARHLVARAERRGNEQPGGRDAPLRPDGGDLVRALLAQALVGRGTADGRRLSQGLHPLTLASLPLRRQLLQRA